jgi:hypothetical protein
MARNTIVAVMMGVGFVACLIMTILGYMTGEVLGASITGITGIGSLAIGVFSEDTKKKNEEIAELKALIGGLSDQINELKKVA